jgi:hypothetical protein
LNFCFGSHRSDLHTLEGVLCGSWNYCLTLTESVSLVVSTGQYPARVVTLLAFGRWEADREWLDSVVMPSHALAITLFWKGIQIAGDRQWTSIKTPHIEREMTTTTTIANDSTQTTTTISASPP